MRIAVLMPYLPFPTDTGGKIRGYYLLKKAASEHDVDLFTVYYGQQPDGVKSVQEICATVNCIKLERRWTRRERLRRVISPIPRSVDHFYTRSSLAEVQGLIQRGNYDLVHVDEIVMAPYARGIAEIPMILGRQKVDFLHYRDTSTARKLGMDKLLDWLEYLKLKRYEQRIGANFKHYVVCSEEDAENFHLINKHVQTAVVTNGVDLDYFKPRASIKASEPTLIYVGTMFYYPNVDAVRYFFDKILPLIIKKVPSIKVLIVGHNPPIEVLNLKNHWNVEVTGSVTDVRPYLERSTAMIVPLRLGGGTRLKIVEAMAMGLPVVSTSIGCEGLIVSDGHDISIADDPNNFAEKVVSVLQNKDLRTRLIDNGLSLVRENYSWDRLGEKLLELYEEAVSSGVRISKHV